MPESFKIRITQYALSQMRDIKTYISETLLAPETAEHWFEKIYREFRTLEVLPSRIPLVNEEPWRSRGIHKFFVENFIAYFWIDEMSSEVWIIAVIYGRRDQKTQLESIPQEKIQH